jgi:hypothetical protein
VQLDFKALSKSPAVWRSIVSAIAYDTDTKATIEPMQLRQRIVDELLIDTHCAFYNGLRQINQGDRAFVHIGYIQTLLCESTLSSEQAFTLLTTAWERRLTELVTAEKWSIAIQLCSQLPRSLRCTNSSSRQWPKLFLTSGIQQFRQRFLKREANVSDFSLRNLSHFTTEVWYLRYADQLQSIINHLDTLTKEHPLNAGIVQLLGHVHHLRAFSLGKGGHIAEALVAVQTGLTHHPHLVKAYATRHQLIQTMNQLQVNALTLEAKWKQHPNLPRRAAENRLYAEAMTGFNLIDAYVQSERASVTTHRVKTLLAIDIWQRIGLPNPPDSWTHHVTTAVMQSSAGEALQLDNTSPWMQKALLLWNKINYLTQHPPQHPDEILAIWAAVIATQSQLADLNTALIQAFLKQALFGGEMAIARHPLDPSDTPALLIPNITKRRWSTEPLLPWLFSRQDAWLKLQVVVAIALIVFTTGLVVQETSSQSTRYAAYQRVLTAGQNNDHYGVVRAAEVFFAHPPMNGGDQRDQQVKALYEKAFVYWFLHRSNSLNATAQTHIERYQTIMHSAENKK